MLTGFTGFETGRVGRGGDGVASTTDTGDAGLGGGKGVGAGTGGEGSTGNCLGTDEGLLEAVLDCLRMSFAETPVAFEATLLPNLKVISPCVYLLL